MLFNSVQFTWFFLLVLCVYWALPRRAQNMFLLLASFYFYGSVHKYFLLLIILTVSVDYVMGLCIGRDRARTRLYVVISCIANLGVLGYFKYSNFFLDEVLALLQHFGVNPSVARLSVILPVGISFYTFQSMGYTFDVARRRFEPVRNYLDILLFAAYFPQLVAGPIGRAEHLMPQFTQKRQFRHEQFFAGCYLVLFGLVKKVVIADNLAAMVDVIFKLDHPPAPLIAAGVIGFAFQIYTDFSGYSDMARGVSKMLGIELALNFNLPYFSRSPAEFWRRWHISLSEWVRDYIYIPLGGNRLGPRRQYLNLLITWTLCGLWHGASANFLLWGGYHALLLILYRAVVDRLAFLKRLPQGAADRLLWTCLLLEVGYGWLLFRVRDPGQLLRLHQTLLQPSGWQAGMVDAIAVLSQMAVYVLPLILVERLLHAAQDTEVVTKRHWSVQVAAAAAMILACLVFGVQSSAAFIYFQF
jgi:alginate O-acetyltransferase complex protein AlgI